MATPQSIYEWPSAPLEVLPAVAESENPSGTHVWVLAEPVPGYPPGTRVTLPRHSLLMSAGGPAGGGRSALVTFGMSIVRVCEVSVDSVFDWACERAGWLHHECHEWLSAAVNSKLSSEPVAKTPHKDSAKTAPWKPPSPFKFSMPERVTPSGGPTNRSSALGRKKTVGSRLSPPPKASSDLQRQTVPKKKVAKPRAGSEPRTKRFSGMEEDAINADDDIILPNMTEEFLKAMAPSEGADPAFPLRRDRTCEIVQELRAAESDVSPKASAKSSIKANAKVYQPRADFLHIIANPSTSLARYSATVVAEVVRALHAERCSIFFVDEVRKELWCVGSLDMESFSMRLDQGIVGCVARDGQLLNIADVNSHDAFDSTVQKLTGYEAKTMLCVPIKHLVDEQRTIGVIQVLNKLGKQRAAFSEQDGLDLLKITVLIGDSFHRQRWNALESGPSKGDREVLSMIATYTCEEKKDQQFASPSHRALRICSGVADGMSDPNKPLDGFRWPDVTLRSLNFNALNHSPEELIQLVPMMMQHTGCVDSCAIPSGTLLKWSRATRQQYRDNPFHSWYHGFSVFQICYYQLYASNISVHLRFLDVFALLIAALGHDLDHPGYTNNYLIDSESELALRYNDVSILENHHASLACELLRGESTRITAGLDASSQKALRRTIIRCILDTDMSHHGSICQKILALKPEEASGEDRELLLSACIHTSDLSAQVQPWGVASQWEERIAQEFSNQACAERAAGREPAPFMQFSMDDLRQRGKLQRDFVDFVLVPMWGPYTDLLPDLRPCYDNLVVNRGRYDRRAIHGQDSET